MRFFRRYFLLILSVFSLAMPAQAKVDPGLYGLSFSDSVRQQLKIGARAATDSFFAAQPELSSRHIMSAISQLHHYQDNTTDFYLLLFLCLLLGLIRFADPRYFYNLWRAFWNPTLSNRQLKEQIQGAGISNLLMNIYFALSAGAYMYYAVKYFTPQRSGIIPPSLLLVMLMAGIMIIYLAKFAAIRFSGWAFRVEGITEHYLFNVFLINKILSIVLLPFIIVMAFASAVWLEPIMILSFVVIGLLFINRYVRSWQVFGSFFQYSKFHFFTYLCASEILPLAVLMKLLVRGLLFY